MKTKPAFFAAAYSSRAAPGLSGQATIVEAAPTSLVYTQSPCAPVRAAPSATAPLITQLLGGTDVTLLDTATPGWSGVERRGPARAKNVTRVAFGKTAAAPKPAAEAARPSGATLSAEPVSHKTGTDDEWASF